MKYAVVFSSRTGNTARLAGAIRDALPEDDCLWFGSPDQRAAGAELIFTGFWTDKGTCDEETAAFLPTLAGKRTALFGTAGFGGEPSYFDAILGRVREKLPTGVEYAGGWMCQGKMPQAVRDRYAAMPDSPKKEILLQNFDQVGGHPDAADLAGAAAGAAAILAQAC